MCGIFAIVPRVIFFWRFGKFVICDCGIPEHFLVHICPSDPSIDGSEFVLNLKLFCAFFPGFVRKLQIHKKMLSHEYTAGTSRAILQGPVVQSIVSLTSS